MSTNTFDILFLVARPAAGKSEIIDYLKQTDKATRRRRFCIGPFDVLDDFPMLWTWFEEDEILERLGKPRLHTDSQGYFKHEYLWHVLIQRLILEYGKLVRDRPDYHDIHTTIVEFARGMEHGGWRIAFEQFPETMLARSAILYVNVSWEESRRKNRRRFNPERPDSILEHALPEQKLVRLYKESDWQVFSAAHPHYITVKGVQVPYAVFQNEDDVTSQRGAALGERLQEVLGKLWALYEAQRP
jgi:hypothetical protein